MQRTVWREETVVLNPLLAGVVVAGSQPLGLDGSLKAAFVLV
jgi:hypothetical protein